MTIEVLGLGESLSNYKPNENITIGVNDIYSRVETDYVVCVDHPKAFSPERANIIRNTFCKGFYSQCEDWKNVENFNLIEFNAGRGIIDGIDSDKFCYSICSPYVAAVLAYKLGAKNIILHGVDFVTHDNFQDQRRERAINDFIGLNKALKDRGVKLFVSSDYSELSKALPLWSYKIGD